MSSSIFLSASVPLPERDAKYFETADVIAIRDSIRALITAVLPSARIVFGGHPAITPMIRMMLRNIGRSPKNHIALYQSRFFEAQFPTDNEAFEDVVLVDAAESLESSLLKLRRAMIGSHDFAAGIFIGGMDGVEHEYRLFREIHPNKPAYPIASTGAAAKLVFDQNCPDKRYLLTDLHYLSLFRRLLITGRY
jgi:hypothetical protein